MGKYTDEEIIRGIIERRDEVFLFIYAEYLPMVKKFVLQNKGCETDAEDLYQDAIIIVYKKINSNKLKLTSSFKTYFYAICKHLWYQRLEIMQKISLRDYRNDTWNTALEYNEYFDYEEEKLYQEHFQKLDKDCQKILENFFDKRPFKEIARALNYSPSYIKKLKFNCKEKLYNSIINDPVYMELMDIKKESEIKIIRNRNKSLQVNKSPKSSERNKNNENKKRNK
jgi:RNA polymerase sigma factor (sigma-70 family)